MIEFDMPAMPIPAAILARTIARAVQSPMTKGPIISIRGKVVIRSGYLTL